MSGEALDDFGDFQGYQQLGTETIENYAQIGGDDIAQQQFDSESDEECKSQEDRPEETNEQISIANAALGILEQEYMACVNAKPITDAAFDISSASAFEEIGHSASESSGDSPNPETGSEKLNENDVKNNTPQDRQQAIGDSSHHQSSSSVLSEDAKETIRRAMEKVHITYRPVWAMGMIGEKNTAAIDKAIERSVVVQAQTQTKAQSDTGKQRVGSSSAGGNGKSDSGAAGQKTAGKKAKKKKGKRRADKGQPSSDLPPLVPTTTATSEAISPPEPPTQISFAEFPDFGGD